MADKSFGLKQINMIGVGTPTVESSTDLVINTNGSERVRIDSNGHIGIANSSPTTWGTGIPTIEIKGTVSTGGHSTRSGAIAFESGSGSNGYALLWGQEGGIHIYTGATDRASATYRAKFDSTGNLAFASGNGIDFSATTDSGGMTSELLNDYEEGTWTPSIQFGGGSTGVTYSSYNRGWYTKIGRVVILKMALEVSNKGTSTGNAAFTVPFNSSLTQSSHGQALPTARVNAQTVMAYGTAGSGVFEVKKINVSTTSGAITLTDADFGTQFSLIGSIVYMV